MALVILSKLAVSLVFFTGVLKLAIRVISGLCHTHLRQYEEHGGTAAPSDFGMLEKFRNTICQF